MRKSRAEQDWSGSYYDQKNHFSVLKYGYDENGVLHFPQNYGIVLPSRMADPDYSITRTFGTNGRTQSIPFDIADAYASTIELNAGGASDTYDITMGVGAFVDVTVNDTDTSTQNSVSVNVRDSNLVNNIATFSDNSLILDYYTYVVFHDLIPVGLPNQVKYVSSFASSVHYVTSVFFQGNNFITFASGAPFAQTIVNLSAGAPPVTILADGQFYTSYIPYASFGLVSGVVFDGTLPVPGFATIPPTYTIDVQSNAGLLALNSVTTYGISINILANSGTVSVTKSGAYTGAFDGINVLGNTGVVNVDYETTGNAITAQVNVGGALQSVANVHGTINLAGLYGLTIDDSGDSGSPPSWLIASKYSQIGDLTFNYDFGYLYQAFWKSGSAVTLRDDIAASFLLRNLNGITTYPYFPFNWSPQSTFIYNYDGDTVADQLSNYFIGPAPPGTTTYGATNLPSGLTLNSTTGLLSGTIPFNSYTGSPYATRISATNGLYTREWTLEWNVGSAIYLDVPFYNPPYPINLDEAAYVSLDAISASDSLGRTPVVTVTGLPTGLVFNSETGVISGTVSAGASAHGPYEVDIRADDGMETADVVFPLIVSGIQLASTPIVQLNHNGDAVDFNLNATTTSGGTLTYSAAGLPDGIVLDTATGQISGTLDSNANTQSPFYVQVTFDDGYSSKSSYITWTVLPAGVMDEISLPTPADQANMVGDYVFFSADATSSLSLQLQFTVEGSPPGLSFTYDPAYLIGIGRAFLYGTVPAEAVSGSPYEVTLTATDGLYSASATFFWQITTTVQPPVLVGDYNGNGTVDAADYTVWRNALGQTGLTPFSGADGDGDGAVTQADYGVWKSHFGEVRPAAASALLGDYSHDGTVDAADYTVWRNSLGQTGLTPYSGADGDGNGQITPADYGVWKSHFGEMLLPGAGSSSGFAENQPLRVGAISAAARSTGGPEIVGLAEPAASTNQSPARPGNGATETSATFPATVKPLVKQGPAMRVGLHLQHDDALVAWLSSQSSAERGRRYGDSERSGDDQPADDSGDGWLNHVDAVFELVGSGV